MARNSQTFEIGNRTGSKLTPELSLLFINTLRMTGRISIAAGRCDIALTTVRDWLRKGRLEKAEPAYKEFATAVGKARADFLALAARRLAQLAVGGTMDLPKYDRNNNLIRNADDEIVYEEKFFPPNPNALMHILDRIDPEPNGSPQPDLPMVPELTDEEAIREAAGYLDLFRGGIQVLLDLGVPLPQIMNHAGAEESIETTASKVEPEPEKPVAADDQLKSAAPAEPPKPPTADET
jgi:hypothetical protein